MSAAVVSRWASGWRKKKKKIRIYETKHLYIYVYYTLKHINVKKLYYILFSTDKVAGERPVQYEVVNLRVRVATASQKEEEEEEEEEEQKQKIKIRS